MKTCRIGKFIIKRAYFIFLNSLLIHDYSFGTFSNYIPKTQHSCFILILSCKVQSFISRRIPTFCSETRISIILTFSKDSWFCIIYFISFINLDQYGVSLFKYCWFFILANNKDYFLRVLYNHQIHAVNIGLES